LRRVLRVDKLTLAALDAVLTLYLEAEGRPALPTLDALALRVEELNVRAVALLAGLAPVAPPGWAGSVVDGESTVGGGSFSEATLPTRLVIWRGPKAELESCHARLRRQDPAVVTRMNQEGLAIDLRTVAAAELPLIMAAFRAAWRDRDDRAR
jgi:L-seryl-tRNA(Ser) seleniumtransferase